MNQTKISTPMRAIIIVVAALGIVGLAIVTSEPFKKGWSPSEDAHETSAAAGAGAEVAAAKDEDTAEAPADAMQDAPAAAGAADTEAAATKDEDTGGDTAAATEAGACCKAGDTTPPLELVKLVPPGELHSPYPDYKKMAQDDPDLVKKYRLPGCNECHGGGGGGGFCPALSQGVWFWGNTDDVLFRLITLGSQELEKQGFTRYQYGTVKGPMPRMGHTVPTSDQLWKIIAFIRSINPPGTNPPEKVIPGKYTPPSEGEQK